MEFREVEARLAALPESERALVVEAALGETKNLVWVPNPGPQTAAYFSEADELLYGGEVGGGKSDLLLGLALTAHTRSLILRRFTDDARALAQRTTEILDHDKGLNRQLLEWKLPGQYIEYGGCKDESDKQRYKGRPHDAKLFDELGDFTETQYEFICTWNRTTKNGQRIRIVAATNPPTNPEGMWIIERWGPWLDPQHPNPAANGELRWFVRPKGKKEIAVDGPGEYGPYMVNGEDKMIAARSRTFIRSKLEDNPDLVKDPAYSTLLDNLEGDLHEAFREGNFEVGLKDKEGQLIPTSWVRAAQERWTERPPQDVPMCAIAADPACGGADRTTLAFRHDAWFGRLIAVPGKETPLGSNVAGLILTHRRDGAVVIIDMGGGYGNAPKEHLESNTVKVAPYDGAKKSRERTIDRTLGFKNVRACAHWRLREALDPSQPGGSPVMLPPDRELAADLTTPKFKVTPHGILVEPKDSIRRRLGRSTDKGDSVVMCWFDGPHALGLARQFENGEGEQGRRRSLPQVMLGRLGRRKNRR
jgi:hypothetical protein